MWTMPPPKIAIGIASCYINQVKIARFGCLAKINTGEENQLWDSPT